MNILKLEPNGFSLDAQNSKKIGKVIDFNGPDKLLDQILPEIDILIIRLYYQVDKKFINKAKKLKFIVSPTTGLDHIDINHAKEKNIEIVSLKNKKKFLKNIHATPEHSWALLLSLVRKIYPAINSVKFGLWDRDKFKGKELNDNDIGILGYGRVVKRLRNMQELLK